MIGGLIQAITGFGQARRAKKMNPKRPTYEIAKEVFQNQGLMQSLLNARMAGASRAEQNIQANQANSIAGAERAATDPAQLMQMAAATQAQADDAVGNLQAREAQNYQSNLANLSNANMAVAQAKDTDFQLNKLDPYLLAMQEKFQLQNAGQQNIVGGFNNFSDSLLQLGGLFAGDAGLGSLYKSKKK